MEYYVHKQKTKLYRDAAAESIRWHIEDPKKELYVAVTSIGTLHWPDCIPFDKIIPTVLPMAADQPPKMFYHSTELELLILTGVTRGKLDEWFNNVN